jgi:2-methylcitrate dehydratase PrpD
MPRARLGERLGDDAAFVNGSFSQALEFDDTLTVDRAHEQPSVAAALALSRAGVGPGFITAIAIGARFPVALAACLRPFTGSAFIRAGCSPLSA